MLPYFVTIKLEHILGPSVCFFPLALGSYFLSIFCTSTLLLELCMYVQLILWVRSTMEFRRLSLNVRCEEDPYQKRTKEWVIFWHTRSFSIRYDSIKFMPSLKFSVAQGHIYP